MAVANKSLRKYLKKDVYLNCIQNVFPTSQRGSTARVHYKLQSFNDTQSNSGCLLSKSRNTKCYRMQETLIRMDFEWLTKL
jgi:hypothetical protein